jgi:hypothetical protein
MRTIENETKIHEKAIRKRKRRSTNRMEEKKKGVPSRRTRERQKCTKRAGDGTRPRLRSPPDEDEDDDDVKSTERAAERSPLSRKDVVKNKKGGEARC